MKTNAKEQLIHFLMMNPGKSFSKVKLLSALGIAEQEHQTIKQFIKDLLKSQVLLKDRKKRLKLNFSYDLFMGTFYYNPKGYGFVVSKSVKSDLFIIKDKMDGAFHGDIVLAVVTRKPSEEKRAEGEIIHVLSRETEALVGTYIASDGFGFVVPDNNRFHKDIYVPDGMQGDAISYDKVVVKILTYPERNRKPEGKVVEIIGFKDDKGVDALSIIKDHNIKNEFSPKVLRQVERIAETIDEKELKRRKDFTHENIFTIDGADSKDLDDAIHIKRLSNGNYELGVHIADVSHYVPENSKLDKEALERSTSVYLIDTVVPMLPTKLSNGVCSLNPNTIRLTLSAIMEVDKNGAVQKSKVHESYIDSRAKLNYEEVTAFLTGNNPKFQAKNPAIAEDLRIMEELARALMQKRKNRGAIEFDFPEAKIKLNKEGGVTGVDKYDRGISNQIIEEFMLLANETISHMFHKKELPFVYRTHEKPRMERLKEFGVFVSHYGYTCDVEDEEKITPKPFQELLCSVKDKPEEKAFHLMLLRSMQQARYAPNCIGHFGLAATHYCHFTSPIRRYPDLQIHRIIKESISGEMTSARLTELEDRVAMVSKASSKKERIAERAERDYHEMKKIEFMTDKIGKKYPAVITGVNNAGFFVTLDNTIDGYVKLDTLKDDTYEYHKDLYQFTGTSTGRVIRMGDEISVLVEKVSPENKTILFELA